MKAAKLMEVPDNIHKGIDGLVADHPVVEASAYMPVVTSSSDQTAGIQCKPNSEVIPVAVKQTDYQNLITGEDFRPGRDTAAPSIKKIANEPGPRSPKLNDSGLGI